MAVMAEDEVDATVAVPAIQVFRPRKIGVAAKQHAPKAAPKAELRRTVQLSRRSFVGRSIAGAIDQAEHLAGVGQTDHQRVIAPGAFIGNIHALLAGAGGDHQRAVHIDFRPVDKGVGLLGPHRQARVVEGVLQGADSGHVEAAAEIASGSGVGNAAGAERVEEDLILARAC
jgi:hypothetical protein